jgi:glycosyltransferase involved in cell wall biosynthesis
MIPPPVKPVVLLGILNREMQGAIPTITKAFIDGLAARYCLVPFYANRRFGATRPAEFRLVNLYYLVKHLLLWAWALLRRRPDIAHYPITSFWNLDKSLVMLRLASAFGAKTVGHLHGGAFVDSWNKLGGLHRRFAQGGLRRLDAIVVLSEGWKRQFIAVTGIPPARVWVVHNPLDARTESVLQEHAPDTLARTVLFLGALARGKGVFDLIDACGQVLPGTPFRLALVGPEREPGVAAACRERIRAAGLDGQGDVCLGAWGEEKLELFRSAAMLVLPSYHENLPLVVLEAAAAGLPVVATRVGALPEFFVEGSSILFVPPGDCTALAGAIAGLMRDDASRKRLGDGARRAYLEGFSRTKIMDSLDEVYRGVLHSRGGRASYTKTVEKPEAQEPQ